MWPISIGESRPYNHWLRHLRNAPSIMAALIISWGRGSINKRADLP